VDFDGWEKWRVGMEKSCFLRVLEVLSGFCFFNRTERLCVLLDGLFIVEMVLVYRVDLFYTLAEEMVEC